MSACEKWRRIAVSPLWQAEEVVFPRRTCWWVDSHRFRIRSRCYRESIERLWGARKRSRLAFGGHSVRAFSNTRLAKWWDSRLVRLRYAAARWRDRKWWEQISEGKRRWKLERLRTHFREGEFTHGRCKKNKNKIKSHLSTGKMSFELPSQQIILQTVQ